VPRRSFRRYLKSNLIRIIAASGLIILAAVFVTAPYREGGRGASEDRSKSAAIGDKSPESFWERTTADPVAAFTGVLAIFTFVLAVVSIVQIYFLTKADRTARISSDAAKIAADASMIQAKLATSLEAPKLLLQTIQFRLQHSTFEGKLSSPFYDVVVRNFGRGPAIVTEHGFRGVVAKELLSDAVWYGEAHRTRLPAGAVVEALGSYTVSPRLAAIIHREDILSIKGDWREGELKWLWVHGFVNYLDVIGESYTQQFCAYLEVRRALESGKDPYFVQVGPVQHMKRD
jgi:hypothetical protein